MALTGMGAKAMLDIYVHQRMPSGLLLCGQVESSLWCSWLTVLCARLSLALGGEVYDAEM